jgi:hypothetical protein
MTKLGLLTTDPPGLVPWINVPKGTTVGVAGFELIGMLGRITRLCGLEAAVDRAFLSPASVAA